MKSGSLQRSTNPCTNPCMNDTIFEYEYQYVACKSQANRVRIRLNTMTYVLLSPLCSRWGFDHRIADRATRRGGFSRRLPLTGINRASDETDGNPVS